MAKSAHEQTPGTGPLLTPPRRDLNRALRKAAQDAQRIVDAFGLKLPVAARRKP